MPNNDLGTAHGRIRVDFDDRGSAAATAALLKMQKQFDQMNQNLVKIEKSLKNLDTGLENTEAELERNTRAARRYSSSIFDAHKSIAQFSKDTRDLQRDLQIAKFMIDRTTNAFKNFAGTVKFLNNVGNFDRNDKRNIFRTLTIAAAGLAEQTNKTASTVANFQRKTFDIFGGITRLFNKNSKINQDNLAGTRASVTLLGSAVINLRNKILGVSEAIDNAPSWTVKMIQFTKSIALAGTAAGLLSSAIKPLQYITRIGNTNLFKGLVTGAEKSASTFERLGQVSQKVFGKDYTKNFVARLKNSEAEATGFLNRIAAKSIGTSRNLEKSANALRDYAKSSAALLTNVAVFVSSIKSLWGRLAWFFKLPKPILAAFAVTISRILPTALHYLGRALVGTSNLVAGLWNGILQLGKGFAVLPGLIASVTVGMTTLKAVLLGLDKQFKDLFSDDPLERWAAWEKLPEHLKPLGRALMDVGVKFKEVQKTLQTKMFEGIEKDINNLSNSYFPIFERGALGVVGAFKSIKDAFVDFALNDKTKTDVSGYYDQTAGSLFNIAKATKPAAEGFRDMAVIGAIFIRQMTGLLPALTSKFAQWASTNRENGQMMRWMNDSVAGVYDLVRGMKYLTEATFKVLTLFKTNSGANFLQRFAESMKKLNAAVKESAIDGFLARLRNGVQNMGEKKIEQLKSVFKDLGDAIQATAPFFETLSNIFSNVFITAMNRAINIIENFIELIHSMGLDVLIGWVLGFVGAFRLLPKVFGAAIDGLKLFGAAFFLLRDKQKIINGIETAFGLLVTTMGRFGSVGNKVGNGLLNVGDAVTRTATSIGAFVSAISSFLVVGLAFFALWRHGVDNAKAFDDQLKKNTQSVFDFRNNLNKAFTDDGGFVGRSVMDAVNQQVETMVSNLNNTVEKAPDFGDHLYDAFFRNTNLLEQGKRLLKFENPFKESDIINDAQKVGERAAQAAAGLKTLRDAGVDLTSVITLSDTEFNKFVTSQEKLGVEAQQATKVLIEQRAAWVAVRDDIERAGPGAVQLQAAIKKIAEAGGDATSKLDGLKQVLESLGILQVSSLDAAAAYEKGLRDIVTEVENIAASAGGLDRSTLMMGDSFNLTTQAGYEFYQQLRSLGQEFMGNVSAGANAAQEYKKFEERLQTIANTTGLTIEEIRNLAKQVGMTPEFVGIAMKLVGQDAATQDIFNFLVTAQKQLNDGLETKLELRANDPAKLAAEINKTLDAAVAEVSGTNVRIGADLSPDQMLKIQSLLSSKLGADVPGFPPSPNPPQITPQINPPKPAPGTSSLEGILAGGHGGSGAGSVAPIPPPDTSAVDQQVENAKRKVEELEKKIAELENKEVVIKIDVQNKDQFDDFINKLGEIGTKATEVFSGFTQIVTESTGAAYLAVENFVNMAIEVLGSQTDSIYNSGKAFVDAFANGIRDNPAAYNELNTLLNNLKAKLHASPPKEGPLTAHGDAARYGGRMFVDAYAAGVYSGAPQAKDAVNSMAEGALGGLPQGRGVEQAGQFLGQFSRILSFFSNAMNAFQTISESVLNFTRYLSDPKGEGTFFGRSLGFKRVLSDKELQRQRDDADQQAFRSAKENARRNDEVFKRKLDTITNAQNAVADQAGYNSQEAPKTVGAMIKAAFPEIASIGGARADSLPFHRDGRALDIMIPDYNTPEGKALGDRINAWALANADKIGLVDTIWQDFWQPADGSQGNFLNRGPDPNQGHFNHVHLTFADGASVDLSGIEMNTEELAKYQKEADRKKAKDALSRLQDQYGPPILGPEDVPAPEQAMLRYNSDTNNYEVVTPHGTKELPGPGTINPETGMPWTAAESLQYAQQNPLEIPLPDGMTLERFNQIQNSPEQFSTQTAEESMAQIAKSNSAIAKALDVAKNPRTATQEDIGASLTAIDEEIIRLRQVDTAGNRQKISDLSTIQSDLMSSTGFAQAENPIDTITTYLSAVTGIASDIFGAIESGIEAAGGAKNIADTLVRGMSNTEDVFSMIDEIQKFVDFGSKIASSVGNIVSVVGSFTASQDYGITAGIGAITSLVGGVMQGANAVIDLYQEAYRIIGSYVGDLLGYIVGGSGGQLEGNIKFLLDQRTNQLLAYSADNPQDKRAHTMAFEKPNENARNQLVGNINVYGGPGSDPRDNTRQMMFQIKQAQMTQATAG